MLFAIVNGQAKMKMKNMRRILSQMLFRYKIRKIKSEKEMLNINLKRKRTINQMMK